MASLMLSPESRAALGMLAEDLRRVFGTRLRSVVAYEPAGGAAEEDDAHALVLVEHLAFGDLAACAPLARNWHKAGLAVPLILGQEEFERTLDVFPIEYGDIIARHEVVAGVNPFAGTRVSPADLRRACELAAKSHLIHLREGFLETGGDPRGVASLVAASAPAFRALLANIARLHDGNTPDPAADAERRIGLPPGIASEVSAAAAGRMSSIPDPTAVFTRYLDAAERVWQYVDRWRDA